MSSMDPFGGGPPQSISIPGGDPNAPGGPGGGDLASILGGAQVPGAGPDPSQSGGQPGQPDNPDAESALNAAIKGITDFLAAEEDDQDKTVAAKCLAQLQGILGTRQSQDEAALGVTPQHKAMGRAAKASSGGGGY